MCLCLFTAKQLGTRLYSHTVLVNNSMDTVSASLSLSSWGQQPSLIIGVPLSLQTISPRAINTYVVLKWMHNDRMETCNVGVIHVKSFLSTLLIETVSDGKERKTTFYVYHCQYLHYISIVEWNWDLLLNSEDVILVVIAAFLWGMLSILLNYIFPPKILFFLCKEIPLLLCAHSSYFYPGDINNYIFSC